uniref:Uncharacterized protein n=1 Tax=Physcomitrium patens TaxID=3218 RepID=A0A2K1J9D5_PHYPA|nr:hypothetical protein PHYPA_021244 [Physcomitrium patens]
MADLNEVFALVSKKNQVDWTQLPGRLTMSILLSNTEHVRTIEEQLLQDIPDMGASLHKAIAHRLIWLI